MTNDLQNSKSVPAYEEDDDIDDDDIPSNISKETPLSELIGMRLSRRATLKGLAAFTAAGAFGAPLFAKVAPAAAAASSLTFEEIPHALETGVRVAPGYSTQILVRWGDKVAGDAPEFDLNNQTAAAQEKQFGYNNDFMAFMPLPAGSDNSENGLLCISHEYTNPHLMWSVGEKKGSYWRLSKDQMDVEIAAHGHSIMEVRSVDGKWQVVQDSPYNRRITPLGTPVHISGPAAGHERMKTSADPSGRRAIGTLNNCAGGTTPSTACLPPRPASSGAAWTTSCTPSPSHHERSSRANTSPPAGRASIRRISRARASAVNRPGGPSCCSSMVYIQGTNSM